MNFVFVMLVLPVLMVVLIGLYLAYVYITQYRGASPEKQAELCNKFFNSSNRYQLTADDHQKIQTGELKIDENADKTMPLPLIVLMSIGGVWFVFNNFFLKKKLTNARDSCELLWQLAPMYWQTLLGWFMVLVVAICVLWQLNLMYQKQLATGYAFDNTRKNPNFSVYKKIDMDSLPKNFLMRKMVLGLLIMAMFWAVAMPVNRFYQNANISDLPINVLAWQKNSQTWQAYCLANQVQKR